MEGGVGVFALLGFLYVPLGRHTGFEHARAVFSTPAATAALQDLTASALDLRRRVVDFVTGRVSPSQDGRGGGVGAPPTHETATPHDPRPVPPKLE
jgi:hypothetical protein